MKKHFWRLPLKKLCLIFLLLLPLQLFAQYEKYLLKDPEPKVFKQGGAAFSVVELGTGFGGFYAMPLKGFFHVGIEADVFLLRDKNQIDLVDPWTGLPITINKENNAYMMDLLISLKKRLFARKIDDTLRPFVVIAAGPVYGINFPEDPRREDEYRPGFSGYLGTGVDIALESSYFLGLRLQYRFIKFNESFAQRTDHSTFDIRLEIGKMF